MQMFGIWLVEYAGAPPVRLEDAEGPVLFASAAEAAARAQREADLWEATTLVCPVRVGRA
jgi:hypothetical protein